MHGEPSLYQPSTSYKHRKVVSLFLPNTLCLGEEAQVPQQSSLASLYSVIKANHLSCFHATVPLLQLSLVLGILTYYLGKST